MKRTIRLTESDLNKIVRRVINEQDGQNEIDQFKSTEELLKNINKVLPKCNSINDCLNNNEYKKFFNDNLIRVVSDLETLLTIIQKSNFGTPRY
jgi:hypothetical protein